MELVMVLATGAANAEQTDGTISPTLMARAGTGGGNVPILIMEEKDNINELSNSDRPTDGEQPSGQLLRTGRIQ